MWSMPCLHKRCAAIVRRRLEMSDSLEARVRAALGGWEQSRSEWLELTRDLWAALAEAQRDAAWQFVAKVFDAYNDSGWGGDIDGSDVQEWGEQCGLLVRVEIPEDADSSERCGNCPGDCDHCYRYSPQLRAAIAAAAGKA